MRGLISPGKLNDMESYHPQFTFTTMKTTWQMQALPISCPPGAVTSQPTWGLRVFRPP